ncbi:MAG: phosphoribosylamine--glycine ligase [Clostridia bacterium]|nr:phosphoribosylamine--glycine ligase [Clostridia bacterium]
MKVLVVGGGGREHAIIWKLKQSSRISKIYCAPGNGGISDVAECVPIQATDIIGIADFAQKEGVDLTIVAPDDPLAMGAVDELEKRGLRAFGPNKSAALIESSKVFAKQLMEKYNIPTADYRVFDDAQQAFEFSKDMSYPAVIKAEGLALGKGVIIVETEQQAKDAIKSIMVDKVFKEAGKRIVIEEYIQGLEVTILTFTDGKTVVPMVSSQDHKRAYDNDEGLNTGGMGTFTPSRYYTQDIAEEVKKNILIPTVKAMSAEGRPFKGVLYFGLMLTDDGPKVLEYNARFGDPEAQVVLPRLKTDLVDIFDAIIDGKLDSVDIEWDDNAAVCVILASGGYPVSYEKGYTIKGLENFKDSKDIILFHAGTEKVDGNYITNGGRVLGVTAMAQDIEQARCKAYDAVNRIEFKDMHYRKDIGIK